jgi:hypothetical protein
MVCGSISSIVDRTLHVLELANVEVVVVERLPAEEQIARRLDDPLALDDALALVCVATGAHEWLEHRAVGLLELQEQRVVVASPNSSATGQRMPTLPTPTTRYATSMIL